MAQGSIHISLRLVFQEHLDKYSVSDQIDMLIRYFLKGGCRSHTCDTYMMLNMIEMNRKYFFFHFLILTSSGGLRGKLILGKLYTQSSLVNTTLLQFIYTHTLLIIGQIVRLY